MYRHIVHADGPVEEYLRGDGITCNFDRDEIEMYVVVAKTADYKAAGQEACKQYRREFGWTIPTLYDPDGQLSEKWSLLAGGEIVLGQDDMVEWRGAWGTNWQVWDAIIRQHDSGVCTNWDW
jgi:hypothetical protein